MSILNISITPERALVGADTEVQTPAGLINTSKIFALPHLPAVIAWRGHGVVAIGALMGAIVSGEPFDALADSLCQICDAGAASAGVQIGPRQEVALVGFSPSRGRIVGWGCDRLERGAPFVLYEIEAQQASPGDGIGGSWNVEGVHGMIDLAVRQRKLLKRHDPRAAGGGKLILATVTATAVNLATVHEFEALAEAA